ncbi:MAG TPA: hypothetical protein PLH84_11985 [Candidatus Krumholzibacteria bacterium]|nr:hypothetical protein [Candidatus Krumholzibacteria bacterium]
MMTNNARVNRYAAAAVLVPLLLAWLAVGAGAAQDGRVTLRAEGTPVAEVLQILAERSGLNIVTAPEVQTKTISIRMENTPFEEALHLVVRAAGLGYEQVGGTILVADPDKLNSTTGQVTHVFDLQYADPVNVGQALNVLSDDVSVDINTKRVIVKATRSAIEQAAEVVQGMDRKPAQVLIEARLIEVNTSKVEEMGIDWEKITKWSTFMVEGYHGPGPAGQLPVDVDYTAVDDLSSLYRQSAIFEVAIDELITEGAAKLLSNAKIVTTDGHQAEIFAGETVPVVITSLQSSGGSSGGVMQSVQLEKIDVGVRLNITPRISEGGRMITTMVEPEVSRILRFVGPDNDLPQTSTRRATTNVRVQDGQTIYLGGLISEEERKNTKKVPLLGDIPLLGALFRHTKNEMVRLDLVVEMTVRVVGDEADSLPQRAQESPEVEAAFFGPESAAGGN